MPSFDIVNKVDIQDLDNAINSASREIINRYDFRGSQSTIELDKKSLQITVVTEDDMKMESIEKVLIGRLIKQNLDPRCADFGKDRYAAGKMIRKDIQIKQGIDKENAKKIVKAIKDQNFKVQAQIMDDQVRVTGKKLDDLQAVISLCKAGDFGVPLQYINMK